MPLRVSCPGPLLHLACLEGGGPVPVPAFLAWGCGGGGRASPGGVPSTVARGVSGQALPLPRLPAHCAGCWGPLSTCCGGGVRVWGPFSVPSACTPCRSCAPRGGSLAFVCRGAGWGGGGRAPYPPFVWPGGPVGRGVALPRSVPLPSLGRQQSGCHWCRAVHGGRGPPNHSGSCSPAFSGCDLCGVLARWRGLACSPRPLWGPVAGAAGWVALRLLSWAGGETIPPASGGGGWGPHGLRAGGGGGGGGSRRGLPAPLLGGGLRYSVLAPLVSSAHSLPACACGRGRGAAPGWGGVRRGPWTAPLGAPADLNPPSALPESAAVTGGSCRARPPYCSGAPLWAAPKLGARVAPARWCGLALRPRPPREQAARGAGARRVQVQPHPPPRVAVPSRGGGATPRLQGGGGPLLWLPSWGGERGGGAGGAAPLPLRPVGRRPAICCLRCAPPGYTRAVGVAGRPRASGAVQSAAHRPVRRGGGGGGGGGGEPLALVRAPVFPGPASDRAAPFAPSWAPLVRRRPAAGGACGRLPRPWCPRTPGAGASSGGLQGCRFVPPCAHGPEWGGGGELGGGGGEFGGGLWSPGAAS